ncbi:MAG: hypothetical protein C0404_06615, partial [Verrucomicrobia bacterium]|nr:hypothetical protein [Verrucomicrobiota bacterium]
DAGGVGGLLTMTRGTNSYLYCMDGNGNVLALLAENGSTAASYEYSPFGQCIAVQGSAAADNSFRFSTKQFDGETGLGYWGYRYYHPETGRWLSRDRIGEIGGINLFSFLANKVGVAYDALGAEAVTQAEYDALFDQGSYIPGCCDPQDIKKIIEDAGVTAAIKEIAGRKRKKDNQPCLTKIKCVSADGAPSRHMDVDEKGKKVPCQHCQTDGEYELLASGKGGVVHIAVPTVTDAKGKIAAQKVILHEMQHSAQCGERETQCTDNPPLGNCLNMVLQELEAEMAGHKGTADICDPAIMKSGAGTEPCMKEILGKIIGFPPWDPRSQIPNHYGKCRACRTAFTGTDKGFDDSLKLFMRAIWGKYTIDDLEKNLYKPVIVAP